MGRINPHRLKVSQLRALVAIADVGTFSDAALQLGLSQSSVSHAIATLEEELGVVLLQRGRQGATLTPLGEQVTTEARSILRSLEAIGQYAQQARGLQQGQVRIAGFRSVATHILPEVMHQFHARHGGIQVKINECRHYHHVEKDIRQGLADIGFTYLPTRDEFTVWELMRDRYLLLLPPGIEVDTAAPVSWDFLAGQSLILPPPEDGCRELLSRHFAAAGHPLTPAYEVKEDSTALSMVQRGLGITIMAKLATEPLPPAITIATLPQPIERVIGVIHLADALLPPAVYAFIETLQQVWPQFHRTSQAA